MRTGLDKERIALEIRRSRRGFIALLGLFALAIGSAAVIADGLRLSLPWNETYTARIAVDNAAGVVEDKQQVRISGLPVGKITSVHLEDGRPVLTIEIHGRYAPLYRDARLRLRPKTPLNDLYLNVEDRGRESAGELSGEEVLTAERTRTPVEVGRVLDTFNAKARTRMEQAIDELGRGLGDGGDEFRAALGELAPFLAAARQLTRESAVRRTQTRRVVHNFTLMMEELGRRDEQLNRLVRGGADAFGELAEADASLSDLIAQFPPTLRQLQPAFAMLRSAADELDPAFESLQPAARALPEGLEALRGFSARAEPSLAALRRPLPALTELMERLRPTSAALEGAFARLAPQTPRFDGMTAKVVPCELAVQKFFHNTISLMKFSDARGLIVRGQTVDGDNSQQRQAESCAPGGPRK